MLSVLPSAKNGRVKPDLHANEFSTNSPSATEPIESADTANFVYPLASSSKVIFPQTLL